MILSIYTRELTEERGTWIAMVSWNKYDGGKINAPNNVKYGDSKDEAYTRLKSLLERLGHEVKD